jgi:hypothetical protein
MVGSSERQTSRSYYEPLKKPLWRLLDLRIDCLNEAAEGKSAQGHKTGRVATNEPEAIMDREIRGAQHSRPILVVARFD